MFSCITIKKLGMFFSVNFLPEHMECLSNVYEMFIKCLSKLNAVIKRKYIKERHSNTKFLFTLMKTNLLGL